MGQNTSVTVSLRSLFLNRMNMAVIKPLHIGDGFVDNVACAGVGDRNRGERVARILYLHAQATKATSLVS